MKIVFTIIAFCLFCITASAQLNTDSAQTASPITSHDEARANTFSDRLHPKIQNLANPTSPGYDMDGAVFRSEAIINRHITNIYDLIR